MISVKILDANQIDTHYAKNGELNITCPMFGARRLGSFVLYPWALVIENGGCRMRLHNQAAALFGLLCCGGMIPADAADSETPVEWHFADPALEWGPCPEFMPAGCAIAVLHGDPARENADIFFRVPAGANIPRHSHTSAERMVLVSGELRVTYDGHDAVVMTPGSYAYGPPQLPHDAFCSGPQACVLAIAFEQPVDAFLQEAGAR